MNLDSIPLHILLYSSLILITDQDEYYHPLCSDFSRDCDRRSDLCVSKASLMRRSCPRTCGVCSEPNAPPRPGVQLAPAKTSSVRRPSRNRCRDIATDCEETADLCDHASFRKMMKKQCAKTCGFCAPTRSRIVGGGIGGGGGEGDVITISGLAGIGGEGNDRPITPKPKPKGIDGLSISELVKLVRKAEETTTDTTTCQDMAYDCPIKQGLCGNSRYSKLMLKMCQRTCNLCTSTTSTDST